MRSSILGCIPCLARLPGPGNWPGWGFVGRPGLGFVWVAGRGSTFGWPGLCLDWVSGLVLIGLARVPDRPPDLVKKLRDCGGPRSSRRLTIPVELPDRAGRTGTRRIVQDIWNYLDAAGAGVIGWREGGE